MYYSTTCPSPVGVITLASDGEKLAGLWLEGQKYHGGAIAGSMTEKEDIPVQNGGWNGILRERNRRLRSCRLLPWEESSGRWYGRFSAEFRTAV